MQFDFDQEIDRRNTGSLKWDRYGEDVLPLWVADMDFASPPCVIDALRARVDHAVFGYSRPHPGLNDTVLEYLSRRHGIDADPAWIVWLPGCVPALSMACGAAGESGMSVITNTPVYPPFLHVHRDSGKSLVRVPLACDSATNSGYRMDFDALESAIRPDTKVFLLCNPHNPAARVFSEQELAALVEFCLKHELVLCSDEIHCDMVFDDLATPHRTALGFPGDVRNRAIVLMAASKTYNIAGLAGAYAVVPNPELRRRFIRAGGKLIPEISPLSFHATDAAYRRGEPWRRELMAYLTANRDFLSQSVAEKLSPLKMAPMEATYLAWIDARGLDLDPQALPAHFSAHGVGLSDGRDFGAPGFVRLNFGCTRRTLETAVARMEAALQGV